MTAAIQKHETQNKKSEENQKWEHCTKEEALYSVLQLPGKERGKKRLISADLQTSFLGIQGQSEYCSSAQFVFLAQQF